MTLRELIERRLGYELVGVEGPFDEVADSVVEALIGSGYVTREDAERELPK